MRGFYDAGKDGKVPTTKNIVWPEIIVAPKDTTNKKRHLLIIAPAVMPGHLASKQKQYRIGGGWGYGVVRCANFEV